MARPGFYLALFATLLALVVVTLGAYTRLTHAGLGCPDWPGCFGYFGVPRTELQLAHAQLRFPDQPVLSHHGWNEMLHRYFAGGLGLLIGALAMQALRRHGQRGQPFRLPMLLLNVVMAQAVFGWWTVALKLWPQVVTAHLLGGFSILALLWLLSLRLSGRLPVLLSLPPRTQRWARIGLVLVIGQIALGGWVSANYAAYACIDLPTCHGQWIPPMDVANGFHLTQHIGPSYLGGQLGSEARTAIHVVHRLGAVLVTVVLLGLVWHLWRAGLRALALMVLGALGMQVGLGIGNVLLSVPLAVAVAHNLGGALLLLTLVTVNYRVRRAHPYPAPLQSAPSPEGEGWGEGKAMHRVPPSYVALAVLRRPYTPQPHESVPSPKGEGWGEGKAVHRVPPSCVAPAVLRRLYTPQPHESAPSPEGEGWGEGKAPCRAQPTLTVRPGLDHD